MSQTPEVAFDGTSYRQRVLATLRSAPRLDLSDPFFIVDLPVDVDDEDLIRARIATLVGFWNKERSPNYKALAAELARRRPDLEAMLLDPARRTACAAAVRAARAAANADRYAALDELAARLVSRYQGLPRSRLGSLERVALRKGFDDAAFAAWLARYPVIEDGADADPLPATVRAQIRGDLDEFGRLTADPGRAATLWTFLGLPPGAAQAEVAVRHAELAGQNERRQHDHQMTIVANLLAYVRQHLLADDQARYAASLVEDGKDRLRDIIAEKVIVDGELSAADYEDCVRQALGFGLGLTAEQARSAVRQVATDLGATIVLLAPPGADAEPLTALPPPVPAEPPPSGMTPPSGLRVRFGPEAVEVTWDASPGEDGAPVMYKITRLTSAPDGTQPASRSLGTTSVTEFEDGGVPGGVLVSYEVVALAGNRAFAVGRTEPALMIRDVTSLAARADSRDITLTWSLPISFGRVVVERTADPRSGLRLPPRRALASGQSWTDSAPAPGVEFSYEVRAEYRDARGVLIRTPGARVSATVIRP